MIVYSAIYPESLIDEQSAVLLASQGADCCFAVRYEHEQYYVAGQPVVTLVALVKLTRQQSRCGAEVAVIPYSGALAEQLARLPAAADVLQCFAAEQHAPWFNLSVPLLLEPVNIPKPWGQEIWYTGIEARGQSAVTAHGFNTPLPWLLSLMPQRLLANDAGQLILLKILDPLPDEVYGDLYFEMHEEKQEVYFVTHIDPNAWPDNIGAIRLGFSEEKRAGFTSDAEFKQAYLTAVKDYEKIRRRIDQQFDALRLKDQIGLNDPVDAQTLKIWHQSLSTDLLQQEQDKRRAMDAFTALLPLGVGDVVKVPCFIPHALQHGVRTVEFQTPVYERKILSFAQKVLTQSYWDTTEALEKLQLDTPVQPPLKKLLVAEGIVVEQIVEFSDFTVQRISLQAGVGYTIAAQNTCRVLMVISGVITCYSTAAISLTESSIPNVYVFGQAMLLSASLPECQLLAGDKGAILLLALPTPGV